jgi:dienelactone hydrolase
VSEFERVVCEHEGITLRGELAVPHAAGPHPAVLVVHTAFGLGEQMRGVIRNFAAEGYVALAIDMFGEGAYSEDTAVVAELVRPVWGNASRLRERMGTWLALLQAREDVLASRIAAVGYCFGGQCVLELARGGGDIRAVVSCHGILSTSAPAERGVVRAHVMVCTGARDPHAPPGDVDALRTELTAAGASWQITEFGSAYHAFTDPEAASPQTGRAYDPLAHELSWEGTLALFDRKLRRDQ